MPHTDQCITDLEIIVKGLDEKFTSLNAEVFKLRNAVVELTADRDRFMNAMRGAAEMALNNSVTSAMMPKDMRRTLQEYIKNGTAAQKTGS